MSALLLLPNDLLLKQVLTRSYSLARDGISKFMKAPCLKGLVLFLTGNNFFATEVETLFRFGSLYFVITVSLQSHKHA